MERFFDLDGTLLDHGRAQAEAVRTLAEVSFDFRGAVLDQLPARWLAAENIHFARYERGEVSYLEHRRERLREVFPESCAGRENAELDRHYEIYVDAYRSAWKLFPDALPLLDSMAGRPMALITNGQSELQRSKIATLGIGGYFSSIIISGEVGEHKPSSLPFLTACKQTGVAPGDVEYVGDSFRHDVVGSRNAGMHPVWLNRHQTPIPENDRDFTKIESLAELVAPPR